MKIVYTPTDEPDAAEEYPADLTKLFVGEVKVLEKVLKKSYAQITADISNGWFTALMAVVWVLRKRAQPTLRYEDMDDVVRFDELQVVLEDGEEVEDPKAPVAGEELSGEEEKPTAV